MSHPILYLPLELMCNAVCQNLNCQTVGYIEKRNWLDQNIVRLYIVKLLMCQTVRLDLYSLPHEYPLSIYITHNTKQHTFLMPGSVFI